MSEDIHKWSDGRYTLMFDEHTFFVWDNEKEERMTALQTTKRLNEQQATINELQSIINHIKCEENCFDYDYCCETVCSLYNEIKHLKEENEQLQAQLREKEQDERLYANEIVKLNKEAKEVLDFKSLGGDY